MSEIIVHLDQQDHKDINLGQEDAQELNLNNAHAVYGGLDSETKETESGIVKYNSETKKYSTLTPDSEVSEGSDNIVTSDAVKKYVDEFGGAIDTVSINGKVQPIDKNKTQIAMQAFSSPPSLYLSPRTKTLFVANRQTYANKMPTKASTTFCNNIALSVLPYATKKICPKNNIDKNHLVPLLFFKILYIKKIAKVDTRLVAHHKNTVIPKNKLLAK